MLDCPFKLIFFLGLTTDQTQPPQTPFYKPDPTYKYIYASTTTETSFPTDTSIPTVLTVTSNPTVFTTPTVSTYSAGSETVLPLLIFLTFYSVLSTTVLCYYCLGFNCNCKSKSKSTKSELPVHNPPTETTETTETTSPTSSASPTVSGIPTRLNSTNYCSADSTYSTVYHSSDCTSYPSSSNTSTLYSTCSDASSSTLRDPQQYETYV